MYESIIIRRTNKGKENETRRHFVLYKQLLGLSYNPRNRCHQTIVARNIANKNGHCQFAKHECIGQARRSGRHFGELIKREGCDRVVRFVYTEDVFYPTRVVQSEGNMFRFDFHLNKQSVHYSSALFRFGSFNFPLTFNIT